MGKKAAAGALHLLTAREVMAAPPGNHVDGGGLLLAVRKDADTGRVSRSWVYRYTVATTGRRREMGLGPALADSIKTAGEGMRLARDLAAQHRELVRRGLDPLAERDKRRDAERLADAQQTQLVARLQAEQARTLARVARDYHGRVIEPTRTTKHAAQWIASLENHIAPEVWHAPVDSITPPALLSALLKVRPHERARNLKGDRVPETLRRIRQRLDSIFEDAMFHGHATSNPAAAIRRKMREEAPAKEAGSLAASAYTEAPAVVLRLRSWPGTAARCFEFAILTVARTSEALTAEWSEFDLTAGTWLVPGAKMKAGEDHLVYLSARALEVVKGQAGQHARWVFPSAWKADATMSNMAMLTLRDRMGLKGRTTVHGLCRATFSTWANETGAARPDVIEACLAHQEGDRVRKAYMRAQFNAERRAVLSAWSDYLARPALALVAA
ncbi:MAG: tyrosine-type recombinase/integrase [Rubrivivax sp.]|nr:tyrosine-type recombinase/integrase [Rubrivivax sp.]